MAYERRPYVLDFVNSYEGIAAAFASYYGSTVLENPFTYADLKKTERHLEELQVLDADDVSAFPKLLSKARQRSRKRQARGQQGPRDARSKIRGSAYPTKEKLFGIYRCG